jgi:hypothetical protein
MEHKLRGSRAKMIRLCVIHDDLDAALDLFFDILAFSTTKNAETCDGDNHDSFHINRSNGPLKSSLHFIIHFQWPNIPPVTINRCFPEPTTIDEISSPKNAFAVEESLRPVSRLHMIGSGGSSTHAQ